MSQLLIGQPALAESLARALNVKGDLPQLTEADFNLALLTGNLTDPEYRWGGREGYYVNGTSVTAVAAQFSAAILGPRTGAGRSAIAVVEKILIVNLTGVANNFRFGLLPASKTAATPTLAGAPGDDRIIQGRSVATSIFGTGTGTSATDPRYFSQSGIIRLPADQSIVIPGPWVLTGAVMNDGAADTSVYFGVFTDAVNTSLEATIWWRERQLLASEAT